MFSPRPFTLGVYIFKSDEISSPGSLYWRKKAPSSSSDTYLSPSSSDPIKVARTTSEKWTTGSLALQWLQLIPLWSLLIHFSCEPILLILCTQTALLCAVVALHWNMRIQEVDCSVTWGMFVSHMIRFPGFVRLIILNVKTQFFGQSSRTELVYFGGNAC